MMDLEFNVLKVMEQLAADLAEIMKLVLVSKDAWYEQSELVKTMQTAVIENDDNFVMELTVNSYIYWLDKGRQPTSANPKSPWNNPIEDITRWLQSRGLPTTNDWVYGTLTKIHKHGFFGYDSHGLNLLEEFWDDVDRNMYINMDELFEVLCDYLSKEVFND